MKRLTLIRHAKSDWSNSNLDDHSRPLNDRGIRVAPQMANLLIQEGIKIDKIVSSSAKRAFSTAIFFKEKMGVSNDIESKETLYLASSRELLQEVCSWNDALDSVALVNHNPTISDFLFYLCSDAYRSFPTCGVAVIDFDVDSWEEVSVGSGRLVSFYAPKENGVY